MSTTGKDKAIRGVVWSLIERFGIQIMRFILGIILARLLSPEEFGIMGIVTVFLLVMQVFIDSGFGQAYIQKKEISEEDANTVFFTNLGISVILYVILWFVAPLLVNFYDEPQLMWLFRVMGIVMIINAFSIIQIAQLTRSVNFKNKSIITLISVLISGSMGVIAAWKGLGVWSLLIQNLSEKFFIAIGLWFNSKWRPSARFSKESFQSMFKFGFWILLSGIITKVFENIYVLVIGKLFPMGQLGYYSQAKKFQRLTTQQITGAVGVVVFPVFAKSQSNLPRLQNQIKKFLQQTLVFIIPLLTTFIVVAEPFVLIFLGEKWAPMIPYLQLLCLVGMLYPLNVVNVKVLLAIGKSNVNFILSLIKNSLRIVNIILMAKHGVIYILLGEVIISLISVFINTFCIGKNVKYGFVKQMKDIWPFYFASIISFGVGYIVTKNISHLWLFLILGILVSIATYLLIQFIFNKEVLKESISLKNSMIDKLGKKNAK